jgi:hypothetical protein
MPIDRFSSGRELALAMAGKFPEQDWVAELARRSHKSRDFVEWHLQEDMEPPAELLEAAGQMLGAPDSRESEPPTGNTSPDELPFSGLPGNLGKLHKD